MFALGLDGSAFYNAREAITAIKDEEDKKEAAHKNILVNNHNPIKLAAQLFNNVDIEIINASLSTCSFIETKWTDKQVEAMRLKEAGYNQTEISKKLNVKQSSVQRRLEAAGYYTYSNCLQEVKNYISKKEW